MKKIFTLALGFMLLISFAFGGKVTIDKARQVGSNFFSERFETTEGMNKKSIPVSGLQAGVYFLRIIGDEGLITRKVVIQ
jgi:hypothetical protein